MRSQTVDRSASPGLSRRSADLPLTATTGWALHRPLLPRIVLKRASQLARPASDCTGPRWQLEQLTCRYDSARDESETAVSSMAGNGESSAGLAVLKTPSSTRRIS